MADYYSSSPLPTPAAGTLPYPWITQFDPAQQATFYVNVETQESTWALPDLNSSSASYQTAPAVDGTRGMSDNMYGGGASTGAAATQSYSSQYNGSSSNGGGEAASFYGSSGTTPQAPGQSTFSDQTQVQYDANGQPIQDGERGLGKVIVGGGVMYMAYKLYKDYQKGKLKQNQFKPPSNYGQPSSSQSQYRPQQQQQQYGGYGRDGIAPTPNWDQKPSNAYGGPPPAPYSVGVNSQVSPLKDAKTEELKDTY